MQDAHDDRGLAGPLIPLDGPVDLAAVLANPAEPTGPGIALGDRVGGDQAERAARPHQVEGAPEEVRDKVRVAVALFVQTAFFPANGGFPTNASKPGFSRSNTSGNSTSQ